MPPPRLLPFSRSRPFSTSCPLQTSRNRAAKLQAGIPPYPYGARQWYKQADWGLYAGRKVQTGNKIAEKFGNKSRRRWVPNVHSQRLWSDALGQWIRTNVSSSALRTIDKAGGLDNYVLSDKPARIKELGLAGWLLRCRIMQTPKIQQRFDEERKRLGLIETSADSGIGGQLVGEQDLNSETKAFDERLDPSEEASEQPSSKPVIDPRGSGASGFMQEDRSVRF